MIVAGDVAGAASTGAHARRRFDHGADHFWMLAHAEIIVGTPNHDLLRPIRRMPDGMREAAGDALEIGEHAIAPFLVHAGKRGGKEMIIGHMAKSSSGLCSPRLLTLANVVGLRETYWYARWRVGASEAIKISANRGKCGCQCTDPTRNE